METQSVAISQLLGKVDLIAQDQAITLAALANIDKAKATASTKEIQQSSFLDNIASFMSERGASQRVTDSGQDLQSQVTAQLIRDLSFPAIEDREDAINEAHQETFRWIFSDQSPLTRSFVDWLRRGGGVYWINGKAASGKSTLMKYIFQHPHFYSLLKEWAGDCGLVTARFYLWLSGTPEQRSQAGLLRSLLREILLQNKTLAPVLFPVRWAKAYYRLSEPFPYNNTGEPDSWSLPELTWAFEKLVDHSTMSKKICLLIDGMDEYEGDHQYIAGLFCKISESTNIKVCISSRPLLAFQDAFRSAPSFRLQDFTYNDISGYINAKFNENDHFCALRDSDMKTASQLVETVLQRADGVFLWVRLVVKSLLEGLGNRDTIDDLEHRLSLIPDDLEDLFENMLNSIDPFYQEKTVKVFQLMEASNRVIKTWELDPLYTQAHKLEQVDTLTLALALRTLSEIVSDLKQNHMHVDERQSLCQRMEDQLKVYCAGLVETGSSGKVQYLHRSVRDFLLLPRNIEKTSVWTFSSSKWDPHTALLGAFTLQLWDIPLPEFEMFTRTAVLHARYASEDTLKENIEILSTLAERLVGQFRNYAKEIDISPKWVGGKGTPAIPDNSDEILPQLAMQWNLTAYMDHYLTSLRLRSKFFTNEVNALFRAALGAHRTPPDDPTLRPDIIALLLKHGANPNHRQLGWLPSKNSAWQWFLRRTLIKIWLGNIEEMQIPSVLDVVVLLLMHGASPDVFINVNSEYLPIHVAIVQKIELHYPKCTDRAKEVFSQYENKSTISLLDRGKFWRQIRPKLIRHPPRKVRLLKSTGRRSTQLHN